LELSNGIVILSGFVLFPEFVLFDASVGRYISLFRNVLFSLNVRPISLFVLCVSDSSRFLTEGLLSLVIGLIPFVTIVAPAPGPDGGGGGGGGGNNAFISRGSDCDRRSICRGVRRGDVCGGCRCRGVCGGRGVGGCRGVSDWLVDILFVLPPCCIV
jgi:hypothetical protein